MSQDFQRIFQAEVGACAGLHESAGQGEAAEVWEGVALEEEPPRETDGATQNLERAGQQMAGG